MTIDESLLEDVDRSVTALHTTRSAFIRDTLAQALRRQAVAELERRHAESYAEHPVEPGELDVWESEQTGVGTGPCLLPPPGVANRHGPPTAHRIPRDLDRPGVDRGVDPLEHFRQSERACGVAT